MAILCFRAAFLLIEIFPAETKPYSLPFFQTVFVQRCHAHSNLLLLDAARNSKVGAGMGASRQHPRFVDVAITPSIRTNLEGSPAKANAVALPVRPIM